MAKCIVVINSGDLSSAGSNGSTVTITAVKNPDGTKVKDTRT